MVYRVEKFCKRSERDNDGAPEYIFSSCQLAFVKSQPNHNEIIQFNYCRDLEQVSQGGPVAVAPDTRIDRGSHRRRARGASLRESEVFTGGN
jgi:hypothetical protein